jgi:hypothetical protein
MAPHADEVGRTASDRKATVAEIRDQIEATRAEMGRTIDAIQYRMSPRRMLDEAQARFGRQPGMPESVRRHPRLATAIGAAATALTAIRTIQRARSAGNARPGWRGMRPRRRGWNGSTAARTAVRFVGVLAAAGAVWGILRASSRAARTRRHLAP